MSHLDRRGFLRIIGLAGTVAASGCSSEKTQRLIPYLVPPRDVIPGQATWYATTCTECPAGCGLLARNRDGRVVKLEGNPAHPINHGALCARGQAGIQGLYDPDRPRGPKARDQSGVMRSLTWQEAEGLLESWIRDLPEAERPKRIVFLSGLLTGSLDRLLNRAVGEGLWKHLMYEPLSYEPLREASKRVLGREAIPLFTLHKADLLISFGADFLGSWISPVEYARQFAAFRQGEGGSRGFFAYLGPRLSQTAANADIWVPVKPSAQRFAALLLLKLVVQENGLATLETKRREALESFVLGFSLERLVNRAQVPLEDMEYLARLFVNAKAPLVLPSGLSQTDPYANQTAEVAFLLCTLKPESLKAVETEACLALEKASSLQQMEELAHAIREGEVKLLILYHANPVYHMPSQFQLQEALSSKGLRLVSLSPFSDETSSMANLVLPASTSFESWGDWEPRAAIRGIIQPVMGSLWETRPLGDTLLSLGRRILGTKPPWQDSFYDFLRENWRGIKERKAPLGDFQQWWVDTVGRGGTWDEPKIEGTISHLPVWEPPGSWEEAVGGDDLELIVYPTIQFLDGRGANRPWLQELPDPITQITWGSWVEVEEAAAHGMGIRKDDVVRLVNPKATLELPAYPTKGIAPGTLAIPMGQGHWAMGRYACLGEPNPALLLDRDIGSQGVSLQRVQRRVPLANTDGSLYQHGRGLARHVGLRQWRQTLGKGPQGPLRLPLPEAYNAKEDFYPPHKHLKYRWAMAVDLDKCIGCGACVVACNAENNVAIVGRQMVLQGREMSWLRIERYWENEQPRVRFLPMLCQHCDAAPCESVCPVYAPHHGPEGLNNQIYNRCIGTRFCSQNCPYKVRRFNWFTFTRAEPLHMQLNPDVTVRQKGVMEKCSFCVQRIVEAKWKARREKRELKDGDVVPACAQSCPTEALVFGNLMDPGSRVSSLAGDSRAYQALEHLNTKPAVIYLKRVLWEV
ncbi:MAG: 4Fe-4S dicluster domain-containing protein [Thermodesulfobacteriota bacterium]